MEEKNIKPKIILTGGHLSPMLAVLSVLEKKADVVVVGRRYGFESDTAESLEYQVVVQKNIKFYDIRAARLQRKLTKYTIPSMLRFPQSIFRAISILNKEKPQLVLTFGGYIALPVSMAAYIKRIPVVMHEQTLHAGLANKLISKFARLIFISFATSATYFPKSKTILTGNPVRPEIFNARESFEIPSGRKVILIIGGSSGSHRINLLIEQALPELLLRYTLIHQTGDAQEFKDYDRLNSLKKKLSVTKKQHYIIMKFINPAEIGWAYHSADIVLSRSGINTVTELISLHKKALLIPLPYAQNNEQKKNAEYFVGQGLGEILEEKDMNVENLINKLDELLELHVEKGMPSKNNAAEIIAKEVLSLL